MEEHDNFMFSRLAELTKRDVLFVLGDFLFDGPHYEEYIDRIAALPCRIKLIFGNHDSCHLFKHYPHNVTFMPPLVSYKNMWLSHCPIHPQEMRSRTGCVHGHLHEEKVQLHRLFRKPIDDPRYFNVNIDVNNYNLVPLDTIKDHYKDQL
jgi:calcineurin-like phosphoesterase family protein